MEVSFSDLLMKAKSVTILSPKSAALDYAARLVWLGKMMDALVFIYIYPASL